VQDASDSEKLYCVYVAIEQKRSTVAQLVNFFPEMGVLECRIIVATITLNPAPL